MGEVKHTEDGPVGEISVELMQRIWANLFYDEEDAGFSYQGTLNDVVDWLAAKNALPEPSEAGVREIATKLERVAGKPLTEGSWGGLAAEPVARAIARDRAVAEETEACARLATSFLVGDPANGVPLRKPMAHEIADRIRARAKAEGSPNA